jgi:uncharacterized membrane protein YccC
MPDSGRIDWRRFPGSGLSRLALTAAGARQAEVRHAVRVCVAVGLTFALTTAIGMQGFWAVFTAVIVVQASTGATLSAVRDRLIGTLLGGLVGAAASSLHVAELWEKSAVLAVTVAVLTFAAAVRPSLKVAPITAAIVILGVTPGLTPLQGALLRMFEVVLGSMIGVGAAILVFPAPARRTALERASRTMIVLRDLLGQLERRLAGEQNREEVYQSHLQIRGALAGIEDVMTQAATERATRLGAGAPEAVLRTLWRLRNDTVIVDRTLREPLPSQVSDRLTPAAAAMLAAAERYLSRCSDALPADQLVDDADLIAAHERFEGEIEAFRAAKLTDALDFDDASRVFGLIFALQNLFANLIDLGDRIDELAVVQPKAPWAPLGWA